MSHGLVNGVFAVDMELACTDCGKKFWWSVSEQRDFADNDLPAPQRCKPCQGAKHARKPKKAKTSTSLVRVVPQRGDLVSYAMPNESGFVEELRALVHEAHTDYPLREETFFERLFDSRNAAWEERCRKENAKQAVKQLLEREKTMLEGLQQVEVARVTVATALVRAQNELLEAHLEQHRLKEAFAPPRLPAPTEPIAEADPDIAYAADRERRKTRAKVMTEQAAISEFLDQVHRIWVNRQLELRERVVRIRAVLDACGKGLDDLPTEVRLAIIHIEDQGDER